jgi:hypothetical protein
MHPYMVQSLAEQHRKDHLRDAASRRAAQAASSRSHGVSGHVRERSRLRASADRAFQILRVVGILSIRAEHPSTNGERA